MHTPSSNRTRSGASQLQFVVAGSLSVMVEFGCQVSSEFVATVLAKTTSEKTGCAAFSLKIRSDKRRSPWIWRPCAVGGFSMRICGTADRHAMMDQSVHMYS